jgi:hypothetical protein
MKRCSAVLETGFCLREFEIRVEAPEHACAFPVQVWSGWLWQIPLRLHSTRFVISPAPGRGRVHMGIRTLAISVMYGVVYI